MLRRITAATLALLTAATLAACDDDDDDATGPTADTTVRLFNGLSGTTSLDLVTGGTVATGNDAIDFGESSTCTRVNAANPQLTVRVNGTTTTLPGLSPTLVSNSIYTIVASGTAAAPVFTTYNDQFTAPGAGQGVVRVINSTATSTPAAYDVYLNPGATLGTPVATNVARNVASAFFGVPATQANVVRLTGAGATTTVSNFNAPSMAAGTSLSIIVSDPATGTALRGTTLLQCL